jgi:hypothetical protein
VSEAWVVNASPLILFSRIGRLDLIERLAPTILIPNAVIDEVRAGQSKDLTATAALEWAAQYRVDDATVAASIEHWDLGAGESQVIAQPGPTCRAARWKPSRWRAIAMARSRVTMSADFSGCRCGIPRRF